MSERENKMQSTTCRFTRQTLDRLKSRAKMNDIPVSSVISMAITSWLDLQDQLDQIKNFTNDPEYMAKFARIFEDQQDNG